MRFLVRKVLLRVYWLLFPLLLLVLCINIAEPWLFGHYGFNGKLRGTIARNYLRYGFIETRLAPIQNVRRTTPKHFSIRWNHPPTINIWVGLSFALFGEHAWAARLPFVLFAFLGGLFLFLLLKHLWGLMAANWGLFFYTFCPHVVVYGAMPNYEAAVIAMVFGCLFAYVRWRQRYEARFLWLGVLLCSLGFWIDWPFWIFSFFLFVYTTIDALSLGWRRFFRRSLFAFSLVITVLLNLSLFLAYYIYILDVDLSDVSKLFKYRMKEYTDTTYMYISIWKRTLPLFTPMMTYVALALLFLLPLLWLLFRRKKVEPVLLYSMLCPALIYLYVFKGQAYIHCFSSYYLLVYALLALTLCVWLLISALGRLHWSLMALAGAILAGAFVWMSVPVSLEGHYTAGSPFEGRKSHRWRLHVLARWLRTETIPGQRVVFGPSLPKGSRRVFRYYLSRRDTWYRTPNLAYWLRRKDVGALVIRYKHLRMVSLRRYLKKYAFTLFDRNLVIFPHKDPQRIEVIRLRERPFTWFHRLFVSMTQPPYKLERAPLLSVKYWLQYREHHPTFVKELSSSDGVESVSSLVALYNALLWRGRSVDEPEMKALFRMVRDRMRSGLWISLGRRVDWVGFQAGHSPQGFQEATFLLRLKQPLDFPFKMVTELYQGGKVRRYIKWYVTDLPSLRWKRGELILIKRRFSPHIKPGRYALVIRPYGRRLKRRFPTMYVSFRPYLKLLPKTKIDRLTWWSVLAP